MWNVLCLVIIVIKWQYSFVSAQYGQDQGAEDEIRELKKKSGRRELTPEINREEGAGTPL